MIRARVTASHGAQRPRSGESMGARGAGARNHGPCVCLGDRALGGPSRASGEAR